MLRFRWLVRYVAWEHRSLQTAAIQRQTDRSPLPQSIRTPAPPEYGNLDPRDVQWLLREKYGGNPMAPVSFAFRSDLERLRSGEPLAYVIGHVPFLDCSIDLRFRPLIPRAETEYWTNSLIRSLLSQDGKRERDDEEAGAGAAARESVRPLRILDVFAGSGCIGLALAKALPRARVDLLEVEPRFCEQIRLNAELNGVADRIAVCRSDMFAAAHGPYDIIVANPPYIDPSAAGTVQLEVLRFEPPRALFAPKSGLHFLRLLVDRGVHFLRPGGQLWFEFGTGQAVAVRTMLWRRSNQWRSFRLQRDGYGRWRFAVAHRR